MRRPHSHVHGHATPHSDPAIDHRRTGSLGRQGCRYEGEHTLAELSAKCAATGEHRIDSHLLRDLAIAWPKQVWCSDITYIPMCRSFCRW